MAKNLYIFDVNDPLSNFALRLTNMHQEAHRLGLNETGHALHEAVRKTGWEIAEIRQKKKPTTPTNSEE